MKKYTKKYFQEGSDYYVVTIRFFPEREIVAEHRERKPNTVFFQKWCLREFFDGSFLLENGEITYSLPFYETLKHIYPISHFVSRDKAMEAIEKATSILNNAKNKTEDVKKAYLDIVKLLVLL